MKKGFSLAFSRKHLSIPYVLFLVLFVVLPLILVVYYAFTDANGVFSFGNFSSFFNDKTKISTLLISIIVAFLVTVICILIAYPVAYILSKMSKKFAFICLLLFITPMWINFVLRAMAMKELLSLLGVPLGNFANIIGLVYDFLPFMILPIYTTIIKIDKSYLEAAKDLGATPAKAFLKVTLPLSKSGIVSGVSMVFLPSMTNYVVSNYLTFRNVKIIGKLIDDYFTGDLWHDGSFIALILLLFMFLVTWLTGGFEADEQTNARGTSLW